MENKDDPRHNARKLALVGLFEWSFRPCQIDNVLVHAQENLSLEERADLTLAANIISGVIANLSEIDTMVSSAATEWPLSQVARIDLTILRMAVFELMFLKETPPKVAIDEAVELAKEFGSETSSGFVNGALGTIAETLNVR